MNDSLRGHIQTGFRELLAASIHVKRWRAPYGLSVAILLLLIGLALALNGGALLGLLGYEASALSAALCWLLLPWSLTHRIADLKDHAVRHPQRDDKWLYLASGHVIGWGLALLLLALIPGLVLALAAALATLGAPLVRPNCDLADGALWYLALPLFTTLFLLGMALGVMALVRSGRLGGWLLMGYALAVLALRLAQYFRGARVTLLDPILGAIAPPMYDTVLPLDGRIWLSRALVLCWALVGWSLFVLAYDSTHRRFRLQELLRPFDAGWRLTQSVLLGATLIVLVVTFAARGPLGLYTPVTYLQSVLSARAESSHFTIHYDPESPMAGRIDQIMRLHEFHYAHIEKAFGLTEPQHVTVYLYPTAEAKERLTGAQGSVFAKPWIATTHVFADGVEISALRHELVHILGAEFGPAPFRVSMLAGIAEGSAEAIAWDAGTDLDFHQWARAGNEVEIGGRPLAQSLAQNMSFTGFFADRVPLAYASTGSFMRWLIDTYGLEKFKALFLEFNPLAPNLDAQWTRFYGEPLSSLEARWKIYLQQKVPMSERELNIVRFTYEQPPFTQQVCARVVALHQSRAQSALFAGLYDTALAEYDLLWQFQPGNLYHRFGTILTLESAERYDEALAVCEELLIAPNLNEGFRARLLQEKTNIQLLQEDWEGARRTANSCLRIKAYWSQERDASIKLAILELPEEARDPLIKGLIGRPEQSAYFLARGAAMLEEPSWIPSYVLARRLSQSGDSEEAMGHHEEFLRTALAQRLVVGGRGLPVSKRYIPGPPLREPIFREALLTMLHDAAYLEDSTTALAIADFIADSLDRLDWTPADRARFTEDRELAAWLQGQGVKPEHAVDAQAFTRLLSGQMAIAPMAPTSVMAPLSMAPADTPESGSPASDGPPGTS